MVGSSIIFEHLKFHGLLPSRTSPLRTQIQVGTKTAPPKISKSAAEEISNSSREHIEEVLHPFCNEPGDGKEVLEIFTESELEFLTIGYEGAGDLCDNTNSTTVQYSESSEMDGEMEDSVQEESIFCLDGLMSHYPQLFSDDFVMQFPAVN